MKKNIIVVVFYICLVIIIITSFRKNKNENDSEKITYSQIEQADVKVKNNSERTRKVLHIKGDVSKNLSPFIYSTKADRYILDKCYINIYNELKKIKAKSGSDFFESIESDSRYNKKDKKKKKAIDVSLININNNEKKEVNEMTKTMNIEGMMCGHCEARVKKALEALAGVESAEVSHEKGTAVVSMSADVADDTLKEAVEAQDYKVNSIQ